MWFDREVEPVRADRAVWAEKAMRAVKGGVIRDDRCWALKDEGIPVLLRSAENV